MCTGLAHLCEKKFSMHIYSFICVAAKFYCIQHIGMTRPMRRLRKRNKDQEVPGGEEDMDLETPGKQIHMVGRRAKDQRLPRIDFILAFWPDQLSIVKI